MDIFAVIGLFFGMTMILIGQAMEGGNLGTAITNNCCIYRPRRYNRCCYFKLPAQNINFSHKNVEKCIYAA